MRAPPRAYLLRAPPTELYALLQSAALGASAAPSQRASQLRCPSRAFASPAAATCAADAVSQRGRNLRDAARQTRHDAARQTRPDVTGSDAARSCTRSRGLFLRNVGIIGS